MNRRCWALGHGKHRSSIAQAHDSIEPTPLSPVEEDIFRVLHAEMEVAVTPSFQDGVLTLHLVMGKTVLQVGRKGEKT